ncbi:MAG TPA: biosynthetic arginine decarboxylase [Blastocatellia bacterium]|jgi:arginine decarboxylase|nr:biosynthetic arginine decarboxylase [Blastocatellia bacterium]
MKNVTLEEVIQTYGVENWGAGYFEVNRKGHLAVRPAEGDPRYLDIKELIDHLVDQRKLQLPILLRFPQILTNQLKKLHRSFRDASREFNYTGGHFPVFPMKVNPRREVVEEFLREGGKYNVGVEVGSKAELYAALSLQQTPGSLLICNGFKDEAFVSLALMGIQTGKRVMLVVEKLNELKMIIRLAQETGVTPWVGLRAKLYSKGSGKWASSGGEAAKFGLTTSEILECIRMLREYQMIDSLKLLHFHIGSQITDIKRVKNAMKEAARVYSKIRQMDIGIEFLDIGGGMGVDYDGSKTTFESSVNYTAQEFANDVIYTIKSVCEDENVPEPNLVTESGRVMSAYHAVFITSIRDEIETFADDQPEVTVTEDDAQVITELKALYDDINAKNYREYYHDALDHKDELHTQFNLGLISLEDRAKGEVLFWEVCARASRFARGAKVQEEEFDDLKKILASKYLCNFSVFRSVPDHWAIGQLFPIMPIHRLSEPPTDYATFVDITCDSDGHIDKFVDLKDVKDVLELHPFTGAPYYIAIFLIGAYQEVMGSYHNLFGQPNEAHVIIDKDGAYHITKIVQGSRIGDMINFARYDKKQAWESFGRLVDARVKAGHLTREQADGLIKDYENDINRYTYLE